MDDRGRARRRGARLQPIAGVVAEPETTARVADPLLNQLADVDNLGIHFLQVGGSVPARARGTVATGICRASRCRTATPGKGWSGEAPAGRVGESAPTVSTQPALTRDQAHPGRRTPPAPAPATTDAPRPSTPPAARSTRPATASMPRTRRGRLPSGPAGSRRDRSSHPADTAVALPLAPRTPTRTLPRRAAP